MKFQVTFKTPDVLDSALEEHMDTHCEDHEDHDPECDNCLQLEDQGCAAISAIKTCAEKFIQYGEYVTIELDTETQTAIVKPVK